MKNTKNVKANENAKVNTTAKKSTEKVDLSKDSKATLVLNLKTLLPEVIKSDDALGAKINKALTSKKTTVETLKSLLSEAISLGKKSAPVENEEKPAPKKKVVAKKNTKTEEKPAKTAPKSKKTEEKSAVKSEKQTGDIKAPMATLFPDKITTSLDGSELTLTKAKSSEFNTVESIVEAMSEGKVVVLACYWTKRHLKEFNYELSFRVKAPKSFKDDLDLCLAVVDCPNTKRLWCMSTETEAMLYFEEEDLAPVEDTNPYNGDKYMIRVSNGMEFEIYTADAPAE